MPAKKTHTPIPDPWTVWFFRILQVIGVVLLVWEFTIRHGHPDKFAALIFLTLISGALGIERLIQWFTRR